MLTQDTQIPTTARSEVRALVKAHKDWPAYLTKKGIVSARAKNADLLAFAQMHAGLAFEVMAILNRSPKQALAQPSPKPAKRAEVLPAGWTPMRVYALTAAIEHILLSFSKRSGVKPRIRRQMGKAA